jgi:hypothetical protein
MTTFLAKKILNCLKILYNFIISVATENSKTNKIFPSFGAVVGSEIQDPGWIKIRIRE